MTNSRKQTDETAGLHTPRTDKAPPEPKGGPEPSDGPAWIFLSNDPPPVREGRFEIGPVEFDPFSLHVHVQVSPGRTYSIDCVNAWHDGASLLDSILQVDEKPWATPEITAGFIQIAQEVSWACFGNSAQGVFCPGGDNLRPNWKEGRERLKPLLADRMNDPLVGKFFHSFDEDGEIHRQGRVLRKAKPGSCDTFIVELFSWMDGGPIGCEEVERSEMGSWRLFDTAEEWNRAADESPLE